MKYPIVFDVIVVGGGHAGTEAALAAARMGANTLLLTHNIETIGQMSCNPAIGGIGKGHLVKEIDAMGGVMAKAIDEAGIQFRILNQRKGPAVRATRAQADRALYRQAIRAYIEKQDNLSLFQQAVDDLIIEKEKVQGIITQGGIHFYAKSVVLTVGTFLGGKIFVGDKSYQGGRAGDPPAIALAERLRALPFRVGRLKTGTPPRIDRRSIDLNGLPKQYGDIPTPYFSFSAKGSEHPEQICCYIASTNENTHEIIRKNLHRSAMYGGHIEGVGPRYCPSIEDKITRFKDKTSHQIFIEPEGLDVTEVYPNGLSTSLPFDVQLGFVRSMSGFEHAVITRPGYAIEYDYFDPRGLEASLETKFIRGLFFAGQINGTTGYEEAAAQGLLAGINAASQVQGIAPWCPQRHEAYLGVLVDDLITKGTTEPYRMFTSRAEYRLQLREDNADQRLMPEARKRGLISEAAWIQFQRKQASVEKELMRLKKTILQPTTPEAKQLSTFCQNPLEKEYALLDLLKRPEITYQKLIDAKILVDSDKLSIDVLQQVETMAKYEGYIQRQQQDIARLTRIEKTKIPEHFDYNSVSGLSAEIQEKLNLAKPATLGIASRIPGVTPAAISLLQIWLKKKPMYEVRSE